MKRFFSLIVILCLCTSFIFADDEGDEYDDGYEYEQNGEGDRFFKFNVMADFPLNFDGQVYTGIAASIGVYRFFNSKLAVGGDLVIGYNVTVGEKSLITVPITFGVLYQPYIGKFEFPIMLNIGLATTTCNGMTYFPSFAGKAELGAFFRFSESWSFGVDSITYWIPQWFSDSEKNDNGFFTTAGISARYHF